MEHGGLGLAKTDHDLERGFAHLLGLFVQFLIIDGTPIRRWRECETLRPWEGPRDRRVGPESAVVGQVAYRVDGFSTGRVDLFVQKRMEEAALDRVEGLY